MNTQKNGKNGQVNKEPGPTPQKIRSWINRQRTLPTPSAAYIRWLRKQYKLTCDATVIKANDNIN